MNKPNEKVSNSQEELKTMQKDVSSPQKEPVPQESWDFDDEKKRFEKLF